MTLPPPSTKIGLTTYIEVIQVTPLINNFNISNVILGASRWQNPGNRFDVLNDGVVDINDYNAIINYITAHGSGPLPRNHPVSAPYVDINGDGSVNNQDANQLLAYLQSRKLIDTTPTNSYNITDIKVQRDLINPTTVSTVKDVAAQKNIFPTSDYLVYFRDLSTNELTETTYATAVASRDSLVFINKQAIVPVYPFTPGCYSDSCTFRIIKARIAQSEILPIRFNKTVGATGVDAGTGLPIPGTDTSEMPTPPTVVVIGASSPIYVEGASGATGITVVPPPIVALDLFPSPCVIIGELKLVCSADVSGTTACTTIMASNSVPLPNVTSASSEYYSEYRSTYYSAWKAFNKTNTGEPDRWMSAVSNAPWYIQYDFGASARDAVGGTKTTNSTYNINTFYGSGTFIPNFTGTIEVAVVAGGGAGGTCYGGGGGAGGVSYHTTKNVVAGTAYAIVVGGGGAGGNADSGSISTSGSNSSFYDIISYGGGNGVARPQWVGTMNMNGVAGGCGGGAGGDDSYGTYSGGATIQMSTGGAVSYGTVGGNRSGGYQYWAGGGGGGGGQAGFAGFDYTPGQGGAGVNLFGAYYAGGGGCAGIYHNPNTFFSSSGGIGGGGNGTTTNWVTGGAGVVNSGSGGGGGGDHCTGGAGGSGVVIIRYVIDGAAINKYAIQEQNYNGTTVINGEIITEQNYNSDNGYPRDFTLLGSNDATNWTTLDTRVNVSAPGMNNWSPYFTFNNDTIYRYYRLNITAVNGQLPMPVEPPPPPPLPPPTPIPGVLSINATCDDKFSIYISTDDSVVGTLIGGPFGGTASDIKAWQTIRNLSANLTPGVTNYIHVVGADVWGTIAGFAGVFELSGPFKFENNTNKLSTAEIAYWLISKTGFGSGYQTPNKWSTRLPWGSAQFLNDYAIWTNNGYDLFCTRYLTAKIVVA